VQIYLQTIRFSPQNTHKKRQHEAVESNQFMLNSGRLVDAKYAPNLIALVLVIGLVPRQLFVTIGYRSIGTALTFLVLVLVICLVGFLTRRFRAFWIIWALASISSFVFVGMVSPLTVLPHLHIFMPYIVG
jgi:cellulose synthase/poly-beta-1,6-N-acetylglucosamine synthase-like glycosyltransferase